MRKFSAHRIYPVSSPPIDFGIIETTNDGTILNIRDTGGQPVEETGLEFYSGIIVPGFVNTHCHLELSHLKSLIPEHTGISGFIAEVSKIRSADTERILEASRQADQMMYQQGISGTGDISNTVITLSIKNKSQIQYHTFIELFGLDPQMAASRFGLAREIADSFKKAQLPYSFSPHAPYSVSVDLWEMLSRETDQTRRISIHHDESMAEREILKHRSGPMAETFKNAGFNLSALPDEAHSVFRLLGKYLPGSDWILVHNTITDPLLASGQSKPGVYWALCPRSNRYIENQLPDIARFAASNLTVCLGTDSLASNHSLSVLDEMITITEAVPEIGFDTLLRWATFNGACALGMEGNLGTIEPGKRPGLVNIPVFDWKKEGLLANSKPIRLI